MKIKSLKVLRFSSVVFLFVFGGCSGQVEEHDASTPTTAIEQWSKEYNAAYESREMEKIMTFYAEDCTVEDLAGGSISKGKEEVRNSLRNVFEVLPDGTREIKSSFGSNDHLCIEWHQKGTYTGTPDGLPVRDKAISVRGVTVYELKEDKIKRQSSYYDLTTFMRQLGLSSDVLPERKPGNR